MKSTIIILGLALLTRPSAIAQSRYTVKNLAATVGNSARVQSINESGHLGGKVNTDVNLSTPFRWIGNQAPEPIPVISSWGVHNFINNDDHVAGTYWFNIKEGIQRGYVFDGSNVVDIGTLGGKETIVFGMNNRGQVTGYSDTAEDPRFDEPDIAFLYTPGIGMEPLGALPGGSVSIGLAINDLGWIAGTSRTTNCVSRDCDEHENHVFRYSEDTGMVDLSLLSGEKGGYPTAMNNSGTIVGSYRVSPRRGFIAVANYMELLDNLGGNDTMPRDINDYNIVVGQELTSQPGLPAESIGFVWTPSEGMRNLNDLITPADNAWLLSAWQINNRGQIIGYGWTSDYGQGSILLNPIPPKLSVQLTSSNLVVSWNPPWPGLVLEAAESLSDPDWQPVSSGQTNVVEIRRDLPQCFLRLNLDALQGLCCAPE